MKCIDIHCKLFLLILCFSQASHSQQLYFEAVYYNNEDEPYKIERKYIENNITTYVAHDNQNSVCIKQETNNSGDSTIIKETSYQIYHKKSKLEALQFCDSWIITSNITGDTVHFECLDNDISPDSMFIIADTILTGESALSSWDFPNKLNKARVPSILSEKLTITLDSLILKETIISCFVNGIPVKVEVYNTNNKKHETILAEFFENRIIYNWFFNYKDHEHYQVDTITFNSDTTSIKMSSTRFEWNQTFVSQYEINGNHLRTSFSDTSMNKIEYLDINKIFCNILIDKLIYSDLLYHIELLHFDREKILSFTSNSRTSNNKYTFDSKNRITEQLSFSNGKIINRIKYKYEN